MIPILETERLVLRGHRVDDLDATAAMWGDPKVVRHIGGKPFTRTECWTRLLRYVGHWALLGYGYWVITERSSGKFIGEGGLADFKRDLHPPLTAPEVGWALIPSAHGRGYATEAVTRILQWSETVLGAERTVCLIDPGNEASFRVAQKVGFVQYAETLFAGQPTWVLERLRR